MLHGSSSSIGDRASDSAKACEQSPTDTYMASKASAKTTARWLTEERRSDHPVVAVVKEKHARVLVLEERSTILDPVADVDAVERDVLV